MSEAEQPQPPPPPPRRRRIRYRGTHPRRFEEKYKELNPEQYPETVAQVRASGKTPAGLHVPILLAETIEILKPQPGERAVDCTLGAGGHAAALLTALQPGGVLLGLDRDPAEIERAETRLRSLGIPEGSLLVRRTNFAGLRRALEEINWEDGADLILADLGVSSMQFDNPARGFSFKQEGPLDMRMNPERGISARDLLRKLTPAKLAALLVENADESYAQELADAVAGRDFPTTRALVESLRLALPQRLGEEEREQSVRRVFQAIRIEVNEEFTALDALLRQLPGCLRPGGRVAVLTFHSGEDRRVKHAFREGFRTGFYSECGRDVIRASAEERRSNPRSSSAKLRWAVRASSAQKSGFQGSQSP